MLLPIQLAEHREMGWIRAVNMLPGTSYKLHILFESGLSYWVPYSVWVMLSTTCILVALLHKSLGPTQRIEQESLETNCRSDQRQGDHLGSAVSHILCV